MMMSKDAQTVLISYSVQKNVEVFKNSGDGFKFSQAIPDSVGTYDLAITGNGTYIYLHRFNQRQIKILKNTDGSFGLFQEISLAGYSTSVSSNLNGKYLFVGGYYGLMRVFELKEIYEEIQTLSVGSRQI